MLFLRSVKYALNGIVSAVKSGRNLRIMLVCLIVVAAVSFLLGLTGMEWAIILLCCAGTVSLEMVNSSLENAVNTATSDYKPSAKNAKDTAAGAVLVFCIFTVIIGVIIFVPHFLIFISGK